MIDLPENIKSKLAVLPSKPGVYRYFNKEGELIYVGKAKNLKRRVSSYFNKEQFGKTKVLVSKIADLEYSIVDSESEALLLENTMIKQYKPRYNILLKDDKTYPWLCVKNEPFPRVFLTRKKVNDGSDYFGPYPSVRTAHILLDLLGQAYQMRTCRTPLTVQNIEKGKYKVCLDFHIHKCGGPCEGYVSQEDYGKMISEIKEIVRGNLQSVLRDLKAQMMDYASRMEFEKAQVIKEKYDLLENYRSRSTVVSTTIHNVEVFSYIDDNESFYVNYMKVVDGAVIQSHSFEMKRRLEESAEELLLLAITELRQQLVNHATEIIVPVKLDYTIDNVEVFSYIDDNESFYVNYMKVVDGAVIQSHSFEMKRRLEESAEELLLLAITELRQQLVNHATEIIVPVKLDYTIDNVEFTIPQRGDKKQLLELSRRNAAQYKIDLERQRSLVDPERHQKRVMNQLKEELHLPVMPEVIECFDNSNFQGDYPVAAMVQFVNGKPNKSAYRHFDIKTVVGPDDYASMKEVVRRRYSRLIAEGQPLPNLIITDGGKGQMEVVRQVIEDELHVEIPIAGLVKDDRHRTNEMLYGFPPKVVGVKLNSELFRLLTYIQDEVHRFAITHHRKKFEKGFMHSELADIKGIGKATAEKLLLELKSVANIKEASEGRLAEVIGPAKAKLVYLHFHSKA